MSVIIAGCGDLGTEAGLRFAALGHRVVGLRRRPDLLPAQIEGRAADLRHEVPEIDDDAEVVIVPLAAGRRTVEEYRATYVDGLRNVIEGIDRSRATPRLVVVSSTAVYDVADGSVVDETSTAAGGTPTADVLLESEALLRSLKPEAVLLRLSGIYGPGRERLLDQVRTGTATLAEPPARSPHTNRIHRDDAAAALVHLAALDAPAPLYIGTDDEPARLDDVLRFLAAEMGEPAPPTGALDGRQAGGDKRLSNSLLKASGFTLTYPTYRGGYRAVLEGRGIRHP